MNKLYALFQQEKRRWLQFSVDMALIEGSSPLVHIVLNASLIVIYELL